MAVERGTRPGPAARRPGGVGFEARTDAFRRAQKHSRWVSLLKRVLPVAALLVGGSFVYVSYVAMPGEIQVEADTSSVSDGRLVMANPKLEGFTKDDLPYSMTAARAIQAITGVGAVELEEINATLPISDSQTASVQAQRGLYDRDKNTLALHGAEGDAGIRVESSDGTVATAKGVDMDLGANTLLAQGPIDIRRRDATITAETLAVSGGGKIFTFERNVRVTVVPDQPDDAGAINGLRGGSNGGENAQR